MPTQDRWQRADEVFEAALDLSPEERGDFLDEACGGDAELRRLVERLLAHAADDGPTDDRLTPGGGFQNALFRDAARELEREAAIDDAPQGATFGRYRILEEIGRGGMAVVYLAERADGQFQQRVALKRIKRGIDTDDVLLRFDQERQILALSQHPNIAQLLDGGVGPDGLPYFVMEYVDGRPIDRYCDELRLTLKARLRLFLQVARAVSYAHRSLVVHRDIKPSNILVTDDGVAKLVDFGIAKLLDSDAAQSTVPLTRTHARLMTPVYASPEQVTGGVITTGSDVYQLGLLLHQLLSGCFPYDVHDQSAADTADKILGTPPVRPSVALAAPLTHQPPGQDREDVTPQLLAELRETTTGRLQRQLQGDLDNIVLMALRKEPERRYGSVSQLIDDVERYLDGRPVRARPDTFSYRAGKFLRRHRVAVVTAAAALVLMVSLAVFYTVRLARERDRARVAAAEAQQVAEFLRGVFQVPAPVRSLGEEVTAKQLLDRGAARIGTELEGQPGLQASMMSLMGEVYRDLALYDEATPLLENAVAQHRREGAPDELADSLHALAQLRSDQGEYDEARSLFEEELELRRAHREEGAAAVGMALLGISRVQEQKGEFEAALETARRALDVLRSAPGVGPEPESVHENVGRAHMAIGTILRLQRQYREARDELERAIALFQARLEPHHPWIAEARTTLATCLRFLGDQEGALEQLRLALEVSEQVYGEDHPQVADVLDLLAVSLREAERFDEAIAAHERALEIRRAAFGPDHAAVATSLNNLGRDHQRAGDRQTAKLYYRQSVEVFERALGPDHPYTLIPLANLAAVLRLEERFDEALPLYRRVLETREAIYGPEHSYLNQPLYDLGKLYLALGEPATAEPYLRRALAVGRDEGPARMPEIVRPRIDLARTLHQLGLPEEAEHLLLRNLREGELDYGSERLTREALARLYDDWNRPREAAEQWRAWRQLEAEREAEQSGAPGEPDA